MYWSTLKHSDMFKIISKMKKLFGIIIFSIFLTSNSHSLNFNENLENYEKNNPGHTALIYILNRCSGVLSYVSSMLFKEDVETALVINKTGSQFVNIASLLYSKHNNTTLKIASDISLNRMMQLEKLYRQDAKEMFLKKGKYLTGIIKDDNIFCLRIASESNLFK